MPKSSWAIKSAFWPAPHLRDPPLKGRKSALANGLHLAQSNALKFTPVTKEPRYKIIGSELWSDEDGFEQASEALGITGICGSGIIEAVAELRLAGLMDESGLLGSPEATGSTRMVADGRTFFLSYP